MAAEKGKVVIGDLRQSSRCSYQTRNMQRDAKGDKIGVENRQQIDQPRMIRICWRSEIDSKDGMRSNTNNLKMNTRDLRKQTAWHSVYKITQLNKVKTAW